MRKRVRKKEGGREVDEIRWVDREREKNMELSRKSNVIERENQRQTMSDIGEKIGSLFFNSKTSQMTSLS